MTLHTPLSQLCDPRKAAKLSAELGIDTLGQLLDHYPRRYVERGELTALEGLVPGQDVSVVAVVVRVSRRRMQRRRGELVELWVAQDLHDAGPRLHAVFFNGWALREVRQGTRLMLSGTPVWDRDMLTLKHPEFEILAQPDDDAVGVDVPIPEVDLRPVPVYSATKNVTSGAIRELVEQLLATGVLDGVEEPLPAQVLAAGNLMGIREAYRAIHRPETVRHAYRAQHRFRFQEAFLLQCVIAMRRATVDAQQATPRPLVAEATLAAFDARLPFTLTEGQISAGAEIAADLARATPMHRLLQGEVGSGKTVIALRAILQATDAGAQAVFLAPTEVLAEQHFRSIRTALGPLAEAGQLGAAEHAIRVELLTGSMGKAAKNRVLLGLMTGEIHLVVGTHALLSEHVRFAELGLIVVDEQHRFGVEQRDALRQRASLTPHALIMTATPIPRTLAMTAFGDLDVSSLTELPRGRQPIVSHVVSLDAHPHWEERLWARTREEVAAGRQVFVVCPVINQAGGSDGLDAAAGNGGNGKAGVLTSVESLTDRLAAEPVLAEATVASLHGAMASEAKDATMTAFARGEIDVLVSTTVIEVGVDVPNATLMIIMDADRFGVAQLHQLRGRVGRGAHGGTCLLVTRLAEDHASAERLAKVASTTNGLELSEFDVESRREGDILGASQSGGSSLKLLRVTRDQAVIQQAREAAFALIRQDPGLVACPPLRELLSSLDEDSKAFLERA